MKEFDNLFNRLTDIENIYLAYKKAIRGKRYKREALKFSFNLEKNLFDIQKDLKNFTYKHGGYKTFFLKDSKKRLIRAPSFKDRVVHHALCNIIEPIFEESFIFDSYACRKKKGSHAAVYKLKSKLKNVNNVFYLKCDIYKYFDSVDQNILLEIIKRKIKDDNVIWLIEEILGSQPKGIPIGNLTSQLFANIYLNELDQFAKHKLRLKYYFRYMDDFVVLSKEKLDLHLVKEALDFFLMNHLLLYLPPRKVIIAPR